MANTWRNLHQPKFFERFKTAGISSPKTAKAQNIIHICDDVYYYWRSSSKTIIKAHSSDIWESDGFEAPYEEWTLSIPLPFHATHLCVRKFPKEICLLWGPLGAAVVTFPVGKKADRIATCEVLGPMSYIHNPRLNIVQAKWHPCTVQTVVLILNNDNFIRVYSPDDPAACIAATPAGPLDTVPFHYKRNSGNLETAIDFDFGPHLYENDYWPIFLLKSSGTISYLLMKFIGRTCRAVWEEEKVVPIDGELEDILEQPATLLVGRTFPLLITVGGLGGSLYHTILLPTESEEVSTGSINLEKSFVSGDVTLFVKEIVVLESEDELTSIQIIPDPICSYRYACVHPEGVHLVTVNFVAQLTKLLASSGSAETFHNSNTTATCTYLISFKDVKDKDSTFLTATLSDSFPQKFIGVTGSGETLVAEIPKFSGTELQFEEADDEVYFSPPRLSQMALNALHNVTSILSRPSNLSSPAVSTGMSPEMKEDTILEWVRTIQKEYIFKQEQALKFLTAATSNLLDRVDGLQVPLAQLRQEQPALRAQAEELAEKYEELNDIQIKLNKRFQTVMSKHHRSLSVMSDEERKWATKFKELELDLPQINDQVEVLKSLAQDWVNTENVKQEVTPEKSAVSPRPKVSAMDLLNVKREVIQHQKALAELSQSIHEINDNIYQ